MDKRIVIKLNMFILNQEISLINADNDKEITNTISVPIDKIDDTIEEFVQTNNIDEIYVEGNKKFAKAIINDLQSILTYKYSEKKVRIYLNGKICN